MKAILLDINALPFDRMNLTMLPEGELNVEISLLCDREAYAKLVQFFTEAGFERPGPKASAAKKLTEGEPKALPIKIKL